MLSEKLCKGSARWVLIGDILISWISWVEAESVGIHAVRCCYIVSLLGIVELEDRDPGLW